MRKPQKDHLAKFDKRISKGYPSDREMPVIIILKRKAIRVYPDNQKVALYYSQALDRYISVPFGSKGEPLGMVMKEESQLDEVRFFHSPNTVNPNPNVRMRGIFGKPISKNKRVIKLQPKKSTADSNVQSKPEKEIEPNTETPEGRAALSRQIIHSMGNYGASGTMFNIGDAMSRAVRDAWRDARQVHRMNKALKENHSTMSKNNHLEESFATNLRQIREKRLMKEEGWKDTAISMIPGVSAYKAAKEGRYLDAAGNLALDAVTVGTLGLGGAAIKGGVAAAKALRAGKGASTVLGKGASTVLKKKTSQKIADKYMRERGTSEIARKWLKNRKARGGKFNILRKFGRAGVGAAAGLAAALGSASAGKGREDYAKRTDANYDFERGGRNRVDVSNSGQGMEPTSSIAGTQRTWFNTTPPQQQNSLPRGSYSRSGIPPINEQLQTLAKSKNAKTIQLKLLDENTVTINKGTAKKLLKTYNGLNEQNKKYMEKMLQESIVTFKQALTFATKSRT